MDKPKDRRRKKKSGNEEEETRLKQMQEEGDREWEASRRLSERFDPKRWQEALRHKRRMPSPPSNDFRADPEVIKELRETEGGLFLGEEEKAVVSPAENPDKGATLGFVAAAFVEGQARFMPGTVLLRFDREQLGTVARETLALFQWSKESEQFQIVPMSGVDDDEDFVWGRITEPGLYGVIGLDADPLALRTITTLYGARDLLAMAAPGVRGQIRDRICELILCSPDMYEVMNDPEQLGLLIGSGLEQGLPGPPGGWKPPGGPGNVCERCYGLTLPGGTLPEFELIPDGPSIRIWPPIVFPSRRCRCDDWISAGPAIWKEGATNLIAGCAVDITVDPSDHTRIYVAASDGGVWRQQNATGMGASWRPLTDQNDCLIVTAVAVAASDPQRLYVADALGFVRRSDDGGERWTTPSTTNLGNVRKLLVTPGNQNRLFAATNSGFWSSTNGGAGWTRRDTGDYTDVALDPGNAAIIYAGKRTDGVRKSADSGVTWTTVLPWSSANTPSGSLILVAVGRLGTDANRTVVAKLDQEVFINRNGGRPTGTPGGGPWTSRGKVGGTGYGDWCHALAVSPANNDLILAGAQELYRTTDGGATWTQVVTFYNPHEDQHAIAFDPVDPDRVYLANDGGVFRSEDGGATWPHSQNAGLQTAQFYRVGLTANRAVGNVYHSGIIASGDVNSRKWEGIEGHAWEFSNIHGDPKRPDLFYVFHGELGRRRYPGTGTNDFIISFGAFPPTALDVDLRPGSNTLLAGSHTPGRIMRTLDGNLDAPTWTAEPGIAIGNEAITGIKYIPSQPGAAYAVSASGRIFRKNNVNGGANWAQTGQWAVSGVRALAVNHWHDDRLYLMTQDRVARSPDGGATWTEIPGTGTATLPPSEFNSLVAAPYDPQTIFLAADIGVFISKDEGRHWYPFDTELPNSQVLHIFWAGSYLYAVTHGRGLWRRSPSRCW